MYLHVQVVSRVVVVAVVPSFTRSREGTAHDGLTHRLKERWRASNNIEAGGREGGNQGVCAQLD